MNKVNLKSQQGITLIALVVTIIVLLILAAVTIATLIGKNGILTQADKAKEENQDAAAVEKVKLEVLGSRDENGKLNLDLLNKNLTNNVSGLTYNGAPISETNKIEILPIIVEVDGIRVLIDTDGSVILAEDFIVEGETAEGGNKKYINTGKIATIPGGFTVSNKEGETTIDSGLVVIDPDGSEFVWVPVDKNTLCAAGVEGKEIAKIVDGNYKPQLYNFSETGSTYNEKNELDSAYQKDYDTMIESIKKYGGFYVGRYETSLTDDGDVQSKSGYIPLTVSWYDLYDKQKAFETDFVQGYMIWGSQYDAMLNWIMQGDDREKVYKWGVVERKDNEKQQSGADSEDVANNIYDLCINKYERTMEGRYSTVRGGCYSFSAPISYRKTDISPKSDSLMVGSRLTLYIK